LFSPRQLTFQQLKFRFPHNCITNSFRPAAVNLHQQFDLTSAMPVSFRHESQTEGDDHDQKYEHAQPNPSHSIAPPLVSRIASLLSLQVNVIPLSPLFATLHAIVGRAVLQVFMEGVVYSSAEATNRLPVTTPNTS
jgi:hypothetical protein